MKQVLNGGQVTIDAEEDIVPVEINSTGDYVAVGRTTFFFKLISGTIQTTVGAVIDVGDFTHETHSVADDKWFHTASPSLTKTVTDEFHGNIRAKGSSGVVSIVW